VKGVLIGLVLVVAACGSAPSPSPVQSATIAATVTPTPTPTARQTPTPTPDLGSEAYSEFLRHVIGALDGYSLALDAVLDDTSDFEALAASHDTLAQWAFAEKAWLVGHPPATCYATVYNLWLAAVSDIAESVPMVQRGLRTLDAALIAASTAKLQQANAYFPEVDAALQRISCH